MILSTRIANAQTVRELVDSAVAARYQDLTTLLSLSSAAVALAEEKSDELPADLVVAAWTQYGNALRIAGRYQEAERALDRAAAQPAFDPPTRIELLEVRACLHRNTGRFESAARFLTTAIEAQRSSGCAHDEARTYNLLGIVYLDAGDRPQALRAFRTALRLVGPNTPLDLVVSAGHNLFETLIATGRFLAASAALVSLEPYYGRITSARLSGKAEWMRARLCRGLRQVPAAELAYERAYALLSTEARAGELADLVKEMTSLPA